MRFDAGRLATVLLAFTLVVGCEDGGEPDRAGMGVVDSAGVAIVENSSGDGSWDREPVRRRELQPPDSALTAVPWGVAADPGSGRVYVIDQTEPRVVVFDRSGEYVETLGREGGGPGEFRDPSALSVEPDGTLNVWDTGRGVLSRWSPDGELMDEPTAPLVSYFGPGLQVHAGRIVTVTSGRSPSAMRQLLVETPLGDTAAAAADTSVLHTVRQEMATVRLPCMQGPMPSVLEPTLVWTARRDTVYAVNGPEYRIDVFTGRELVASIRRPVDPVTVTRRMAADRARLQFRGFLRRCGISAARLVEEVGHSEQITPVRWLTTDPDGRLWVARGPGHMAAEHVDVFSPVGRYRWSIETEVMPVAFVSSSRFVGLRLQDATGRPVLSLVDLEETGAGAPGEGTEDGRPAWAPPVHEDLREFRDCAVCPVVVRLPAGEFVMGAPEGEAPAEEIDTRPRWTEEAEEPQVEVTIDRPFAIGMHEVTFDQWEACVGAGGCEYRPDDEGWGRGARPVIHVSRSDARRYVEWLSRHTGEEYRLPSEAEWEYAARAGTRTARWWGDDLGDGRVPCDGCGTSWDRRSTAPAGSFPPNPWGLHDMLSNVAEWVADCWHESHVGRPGDGSPRIESSPWWREEGWEDRRGEPCRRPVHRGGAYSWCPWTIRAANRGFYWPHPNWYERKSYTRGFRVAREVRDAS